MLPVMVTFCHIWCICIQTHMVLNPLGLVEIVPFQQYPKLICVYQLFSPLRYQTTEPPNPVFIENTFHSI